MATKLHTQTKDGSRAEMLEMAEQLVDQVKDGNVQALSIAFVSKAGEVHHVASYPTKEDRDVWWLALRGALDIVKNSLGRTVDDEVSDD